MDNAAPDSEATKPPVPAGAEGELAAAVSELRAHLVRVERLVGSGHLFAGTRQPAGEQRWPVTLAVAAAIALQLALPASFDAGPRLLLPLLEAALGLGLLVANPRRIDRSSQALRAASVTLTAAISLANAWSSYQLISGLVSGVDKSGAALLLASGSSIYLTNIVVFALWYWEWDQGGPASRAADNHPLPDFLFPQQSQPAVARQGWRPTFLDYLYTSYTNATAFSPTDTMPLSGWAKALMLLQSAVALTTMALVIARAVNILG